MAIRSLSLSSISTVALVSLHPLPQPLDFALVGVASVINGVMRPVEGGVIESRKMSGTNAATMEDAIATLFCLCFVRNGSRVLTYAVNPRNAKAGVCQRSSTWAGQSRGQVSRL